MRKLAIFFLVIALMAGEKLPVILNGKIVGHEEVNFSGNCMTSHGNYGFIPMGFKMKICYEGSLPSYFSFSGTVRGMLQRIVVRKKGNSLRGTITAGSNTFPLSVKLTGPTLILPSGPLSPFLMAYRVIRKNSLRSARAYIIPQTFLDASISANQEVSITMAGLKIRVGKDFVLIPAQNFSLGKPPEKTGKKVIKIQGTKPGTEEVSQKDQCLVIKRDQMTVVDGILEYCPGRVHFKGTLYAGLFSYPSEFEAKREDFPSFVHLNPFLSLPILQEEWTSLPEKFRLLLPPPYFYPRPYTLPAEIIPAGKNLYYLKISSSQGFFVRTEKGIPMAMGDPLSGIFVNQEKLSLKPPSYNPKKGKEVNINGLCGTLLLPPGAKAGVVFVSGSGPQDRNENSPVKWGLKTYLFARIADHLYSKGIASLRTDDREVGCSRTAKPGLQSAVQDVVSQVEFLRKTMGKGKIYILGHSLGVLIALMASGKTKVDGLILLGAYSGKGKDIVFYQVKDAVKGAEKPYREAALREEERLISALLSRNLSERDRKILATPYIDYLREFFSLNPADFAKFAPERVLIINGSLDHQTPPYSAKQLAQALRACGENVEFLTLPTDHLFLPSPTGEVSLYGFLIYTGKTPDPLLYQKVADWILEGLKKGKEN